VISELANEVISKLVIGSADQRINKSGPEAVGSGIFPFSQTRCKLLKNIQKITF
jgi:hypothetical protein